MNYNKYFKNLKKYNDYLGTISYRFFNIVSLNVRSASSLRKFNQLRNFICELYKLPDIIAIQETWFASCTASIYEIQGFNSVHSCRTDGFGGTSIYIRANLNYTVN